jgi:hypothetical protein
MVMIIQRIGDFRTLPPKGSKHSEETKQKIAEGVRRAHKAGKFSFLEGNSYSYGFKHAEETKRKMSEAHKGRKKTKEHARNISKGLKKLYAENPELRENISARLCGVPLSDEHKSNMSAAQLRRFSSAEARELLAEQIREGMQNSETRDKLRRARLEQWQDPEQRAKLVPHLLDNLEAQGEHKSTKAGTVYYRSSYELAFFEQLDCEDDVVSYEVESEKVEYEFDGAIRTYIPDVKIVYVDGSWEVVEVKPENLLDHPVNIAKFDAAEKMYGDRFCIVTEKELGIG